MADGSMFSNLKKYRDNYSFYDTNPIVEIYNSYSVEYYKIFAFLVVNGNGGSDFEFWKYNDLSDPDVFNFYVDTSRNKSLIDTAVDVQYGDKILALVTCNSGSSSNNDRFMVVARKLRDGEELYDGCYRIG
jgi:sortase B